MLRWIILLAVVLCAQLVYTVYAYIPRDQIIQSKSVPWLAVKMDQVDKVQLSTSQGESLELVKQQDAWVIPAQSDYPVLAQRVEMMFTKFAKLDPGWPVATTDEAVKRFQLAADNYERKIVFYQQGRIAETFYIGSSPGLRKAYVRKEGQSNVYVEEVSVFDAPLRLAEWFDFGALSFDVADISQVEVAGLQLQQLDGIWQTEGLGPSERLNTDGLQQWLSQLSTLQFDHVVSAEMMPSTAKRILSMVYQGQPIHFELGQAQNGIMQIFKRSDLPYYFSLQVSQAAPLVTINRQQLIHVEQDAPSQQTGSAPMRLGDDADSINALREMLDKD